MIAVLSPAKRLYEGPAVEGLGHAAPPLLDEATDLIARARDLSEDDLKDLMGISDQLAELNVARFQDFETPFTPSNARQAIRMFAGDTYLGFDAETVDADALAWGQDHLVILSGLYGVLRPLDLMQPYRLEMGTKLGTPRGDDLYAWWGDRLGTTLGQMLEGQAHRVLVNLASKEYFKAVDVDAADARVITPRFEEEKDGKARVLFMFAKKARGRMARWILQHRVTDPEQLTAFEEEGYAFVPEDSTPDKPVFRRPQPPKQR